MKNILTTLLLSATVLFCFPACGSDDDGGGSGVNCDVNTFNTQANPFIMDISNLAAAYGNDPSTVNCNNYLQSIRDYLDFADDYINCSAIYTTQYQESLDESRMPLDMVVCP